MSAKTCFFVCPIGEPGSDTRKNSDTLLDYIIKPCFEHKEYNVIRADKILQTDIITNTIIDHLTNSDIVIADVSEANPNVYFELGYTTALKKPLIQICESGIKLPFDISVTRTFYYNLKDISELDNIKKTILELIDNIENQQTEITKTTTELGNEIGTLFAAGMLSDMLTNPEKSEQYVDLFSNLGKMKKALDEIQ